MNRFKSWATALALLAVVASTPASAQGQAFPSKPIRVVVPFAPGGTTDVLARGMAGILQGRLGVPVVIDNKPGGSGAIGIENVARSPADGYTLLWGTDAVTVQPLLRKDFPVDPQRDLTPLVQVGYTPMLILVGRNFPAKDIQSFIAMAKAKPGELRYGSGGTGTVVHIAAERFRLAAGIDVIHVPYKGTGPALVDAVGGHIEAVITGVPEVMAQVKSGDLRPLVFTGEQRSPLLPEVPTLAESGFPGFFAAGWMGVLGPANLPTAIADKLATALQEAAQSPEFRKIGDQAGLITVSTRQAQTARDLKEQSDRFRDIIGKAGIKAE
ncbi:tripartite tricarboxylate transporter substrate binding protein [soil metagenome]